MSLNVNAAGITAVLYYRDVGNQPCQESKLLFSNSSDNEILYFSVGEKFLTMLFIISLLTFIPLRIKHYTSLTPKEVKNILARF